MSSNYPEGSMMGSGIYSTEVDYAEFECDNEECGKHNDAGITATDDWGNYTIECEFCGSIYEDSSLDSGEPDYDPNH